MKLTTDKTLNATADQIWNLLGERFADIGAWSKAIERSELNGPLDEGGVRTCELKPTPIGSGTIRERITRFNRGRREVSYEILEGLPGFMRYVETAWTVAPTVNGRAQVKSVLTIRLAWYARPLALMVRRQFAKTIDGFMMELETKAPSEDRVVEAVAMAG